MPFAVNGLKWFDHTFHEFWLICLKLTAWFIEAVFNLINQKRARNIPYTVV